MTQKELQSLCETWTEYIQGSTDNENVRYFIRHDGQLMYETEDEDFFESNEKYLVDDINDTFNEYFLTRDTGWLVSEFMERALDVQQDNGRWSLVYNTIMEIPNGNREHYIIDTLKELFDDPFKRADYLLHSLK